VNDGLVVSENPGFQWISPIKVGSQAKVGGFNFRTFFSAELNRDRKLQLDSIFDVQKWEFIGGYQQITEIGGYYNGCFYII
jgi:hypothetical protein